MNSFKVSYVTTLPKEGNAPRVTITGDEDRVYEVSFCEYGGEILSQGICKTNQIFIGPARQWYTDWQVIVRDITDGLKDDVVLMDVFNPKDKTIFIKIDAYALGDNIAWMPYIEEFRKRHKCRVICSTFFNDLFFESYPNILFVKPNTIIENVYAQYYIGASNDDNPYYSPVKVDYVPLQKVAASILGLDFVEINPDIKERYKYSTPKVTGKYVTIAEFGSSQNKEWKAENGWQQVVDFLNSKGYKVLVISREPTKLQNVIDLTGDKNLDERAIDIMHADFHMGISSGLSWLAWALGTYVVLISDVTPNWHEFQTLVIRVNANDLACVNYQAEGCSTIEKVIEKLVELGVE